MNEELIPDYDSEYVRHVNKKNANINISKEKVLAWEHYKKNKEGEIPTLEKFKSIIASKSRLGYVSTTVCLPIVLFLTGCRIHELLPTYTEWTAEEKKKHTWERTPKKKLHPGVMIKDLTFTTKNDSPDFLKIRTRTEKLGKKDWKTAFIKIDQNNHYSLLIEILDNYILELTGKSLAEFTQEDYNRFGHIELFPFCSSVARRKVKRVFGREMSMHLIRVWRAKQLVRDHNFSPQKLKKFIGWSSNEMPMHYTESTEKELEKTLEDTDVYDFNKLDDA